MATEANQNAEYGRQRLEAAEVCASLLRDHLTGDGGFGGKPIVLPCAGCRDAVQKWERARDALTDDTVRPYITAEDWERAVRWQQLNYPPDIFPPDSDSVDARSGTFARKVCDGIIKRAELYAEMRHNDGEVRP